MGRKKKYLTEEDRKAAKKEWQKKATEKYLKTEKGAKMYRAKYLISNYKKEDDLYNRGKCDLTAKWIVNNIFTKKCAHCEETDWHNIGCNRLDNSKPHTMDNVEPCCLHCNMTMPKEDTWKKKYGLSKKIPCDQIDKITGEIIKSWNSATDAEEEGGFNAVDIRQCCKGSKKTHMGFLWKLKK